MGKCSNIMLILIEDNNLLRKKCTTLKKDRNIEYIILGRW